MANDLRRIDELQAKAERLRAVLEDILDGHGGCRQRYDGCDKRCRATALAALAQDEVLR